MTQHNSKKSEKCILSFSPNNLVLTWRCLPTVCQDCKAHNDTNDLQALLLNSSLMPSASCFCRGAREQIQACSTMTLTFIYHATKHGHFQHIVSHAVSILFLQRSARTNSSLFDHDGDVHLSRHKTWTLPAYCRAVSSSLNPISAAAIQRPEVKAKLSLWPVMEANKGARQSAHSWR
jgi:hypothetical protein